jgi:hypothetical protein
VQHLAALVLVGILDQHGSFPVGAGGDERVVRVELALYAFVLEDALGAQHLLDLVADGELVLEYERDVLAERYRAVLLVRHDASAELGARFGIRLKCHKAFACDLRHMPVSRSSLIVSRSLARQPKPVGATPETSNEKRATPYKP